MTILLLVCGSPTSRRADGSPTSVYRVPTLLNPTVDRWPGSCIYPAMRKISFMKVALACFSLGLLSPRAALAHGDGGLFGTAGAAPKGIELIAFEAPGCIYCPVFRRDVVPSYAATPAGKTAPLRFIDLNEPGAGRLKLSGPVTMVPTLVLVRDGVEIGRIAGYVGRESMHRILAAMLPSE